MGLDLVEFVMELESTFGIDIPDRDAERLVTPRLVIEYLAARLPSTTEPFRRCLSQRAFYQVRGAVARRVRLPRQALRPETPLRGVLGAESAAWRTMGRELGAQRWPRLQSDHWAARHLGGVRTLGEAARHLADHDVAMLRGPEAPWTHAEIEQLVLQVLVRETAVDMQRYSLDSRFVQDMGLD